MKYSKVYDGRGRIRVRYGSHAFDKYSAMGLTDYLKTFEYIKEVKVSTSNGSVLINYLDEHKDKVLSLLDGMTKEKMKQIAYPIDEELERLNRNFKVKALKLIAKKALIPLIFPQNFMGMITLFKSYKFIKSGIASLLNGDLDVNVLDATSISVSMMTGDYSTANSIMFLLNFSSLLEEYTMRSANLQLAKSLEINVDYVWVEENGTQVKKPMSLVEKGDIVIVKTGSMIPIDGTVVKGEALINEASMTGESAPVRKYNGLSVYAGCIVEDGSINIEVTAIDNQTRISKIIDLIDKSQDLKARIQQKAQKTADEIVPFSLLTFAGVYLFTRNITKATAVLMVDYSCAIKLSTPITVISAMKEASQNSIVVKGGKFLEEYAAADTIVFDKTGTLTNATPSLAKITPFYGYSQDEVLRIAACLEEHFPHSVARAVVRAAEMKKIEHEEKHAEVEYIVAHGIATRLDGQRTLIGSRHFIEDDEKVLLTDEQREILKNECAPYSNLFLSYGDKIIGILSIEDPPRQEAKEVIAKLKEQGFKNIVMITGDNEVVANNVCKKLGINHCYSQVLPDGKYKIIEELKSQGKKVVMVGDGINDSPALSAADVSIAMKDASDIAREVADITLLSSDLNDLILLRELSAKLFKRIEDNYSFIINFNSALILLGVFGVLSPATTALLHNVSTVVISGMSTRKYLK
ncbi:ATPase, P-type (transporting), HAD superfamily, subfamily IC/heavy metal translocating P-type ATPase [[Eubacterium] yurii]|jgi:heavy metal translocating P-type ATPase|nr:ATPase, P-type (transporting), HAD superfamily, subfamily IC/heavy metal translocating P-type ATPase [[Eubacterium] yurii]